jgi:hypothetical protein
MRRFIFAVCPLVFWTTAAHAQQWLEQGADTTIVIGPFLNALDGVTPEGSLTISQSDIRLSKNGDPFAQTSNTAGATVMENGYYSVPLNETDTSDPGLLRVAVNEAGALPVWQDFMVVPANVYDSLVGGTVKLQTDVTQVGGTTQTAGDIIGDTNDIQNRVPNSTAAMNMNLVFDHDFGDNYNVLFDRWIVEIDFGGLTSGGFANGAIDNTAFNVTETLTANPASGGIVAASFGAGAIDANAIATAAIQDLELNVTGSEFTAIPWNAAWDNEVQSEVNDEIVLQNLDHLIKSPIDTNFATTVHLDSVIGQLADSGTSPTFDRTTDSLEAIRDNQPANFGGLTITGGRVNADVTHWLNAPVTTNVDGVPKVDITHVLGDPVCD